MNPQTAPPIALHDEALDRILTALRETPAPTGMNQRITSHIARAAEARAVTPSPFAVLLNAVKAPRILYAQTTRYAFAATTFAALLAASAISFTLHRKPAALTLQNPSPASKALQTSTQPTDLGNNQVPQRVNLGENQVPQRFSLGENQVPQRFSPGENQVPQGFSLGSHSHLKIAGVSTPASTGFDPDALALAETLAPSRPIPIMPLTAEEHLLILATRQGQPIEVAELETLHQPAIQAAAAARERATIRSYVHSLLGPMAAAEAITPTPPVDDPTSQPPSR